MTGDKARIWTGNERPLVEANRKMAKYQISPELARLGSSVARALPRLMVRRVEIEPLTMVVG